jgi:uncharacterized protein (TIGR04255 family)
MDLPKKIAPCPIVEAIIELRFEPDIPDEAVFGLIHKEIKNEYTHLQKLPILDLPEHVKKNQPNLKFKPYYKFSNETYDINLGPRVISLIKKEPYEGWQAFSKSAKSILNKLNQLEIIKKIERLGLRYINFFDGNIYDKVNLALTLGNESFIKKDTYIKNVFEESGHKVILQLGNSANLNKNNEVRKGSLLDVDVHLESLSNEFLLDSDDILNSIHKIEKEIFFKLLEDNFIKELNPQYQ